MVKSNIIIIILVAVAVVVLAKNTPISFSLLGNNLDFQSVDELLARAPTTWDECEGQPGTLTKTGLFKQCERPTVDLSDVETISLLLKKDEEGYPWMLQKMPGAKLFTRWDGSSVVGIGAVLYPENGNRYMFRTVFASQGDPTVYDWYPGLEKKEKNNYGESTSSIGWWVDKETYLVKIKSMSHSTSTLPSDIATVYKGLIESHTSAGGPLNPSIVKLNNIAGQYEGVQISFDYDCLYDRHCDPSFKYSFRNAASFLVAVKCQEPLIWTTDGVMTYSAKMDIGLGESNECTVVFTTKAKEAEIPDKLNNPEKYWAKPRYMAEEILNSVLPPDTQDEFYRRRYYQWVWQVVGNLEEPSIFDPTSLYGDNSFFSTEYQGYSGVWIDSYMICENLLMATNKAPWVVNTCKDTVEIMIDNEFPGVVNAHKTQGVNQGAYALLIWVAYEQTGDIQLLENTYPMLVENYNYYADTLDQDNDYRQECMPGECGDNSPRYEFSTRFEGMEKTEVRYINAMMLYFMAKELGLSSDEEYFYDQAVRVKYAVQQMWDDNEGWIWDSVPNNPNPIILSEEDGRPALATHPELIHPDFVTKEQAQLYCDKVSNQYSFKHPGLADAFNVPYPINYYNKNSPWFNPDMWQRGSVFAFLANRNAVMFCKSHGIELTNIKDKSFYLGFHTISTPNPNGAEAYNSLTGITTGTNIQYPWTMTNLIALSTNQPHIKTNYKLNILDVVPEGVPINTTCTPSWTCTAWSSCLLNQQTRVCTDSNNCGTLDGRPAQTQSCTTTCHQYDAECDGLDSDDVNLKITQWRSGQFGLLDLFRLIREWKG